MNDLDRRGRKPPLTHRVPSRELIIGFSSSSLLASGAARSPSSSGWHSASEDESHWGPRCFSEEVLGGNEAPAHVRSPQTEDRSARSPWRTGARGHLKAADGET